MRHRIARWTSSAAAISIAALSLGAAAPHPGAPLFTNPAEGNRSPLLTDRCEGIDQLTSAADALTRLDWAISCNLIPSNVRNEFTYDIQPDGSTAPSPHPRYPSFGYNDKANAYPVWRPDTSKNSSGLYDNCSVPDNVIWVSICSAGCYAPEQRVLYASGYTPIAQAYDSTKLDLVTLAPDATFDDLRFVTNKVHSYSSNRAPTQQELFDIGTHGGGLLRVTHDHALVVGDGTLRRAQDLRVGDALVREDGTPDPITAITRESFYGRTYNVAPESIDLASNIVVAEGFLSGSSRYQNEYIAYLRRLVLRHTAAPE